jgi:hypothetical protein
MITAIVLRYKDRTAKAPLELYQVGEFKFDSKELEGLDDLSAMYRVLTKHLDKRRDQYKYPMQFWTLGNSENEIRVVLDDRAWLGDEPFQKE